MALITANYSPQSSAIDLRNLGNLSHTAEVQNQRHLKTLQALHKQAELTADDNYAWRERERRREEKYAVIDATRRQEGEERADAAQRAAEHRAARADAAVAHEEAMRAAAAAKVQAVEERLERFAQERAEAAVLARQRIAGVDAKREATYRAGLELLEARRQELLGRERRLEDILRQREELRQLNLQIKAEEDFAREQARRATRARGDAALEARVKGFHERNTAKDEYAARRKQDIEHLRRTRAEELRQRFEYIAAQAADAAAVAEAERQALAGRLSDKAARGEALESQRQALLGEMSRLRHQMQAHEEVLRSALLRMRQQGSTALPEEVVRSLEGLRRGGPVRATATSLLPASSPAAGGAGRPLAIEYGTPGAGAKSPRRPSSASATPRSGSKTARAAEPRPYLTSMISPRVGQPGKARRVGGRTGGRPLSASADFRRSASHGPATAAPATPTRPATAAPGASASASATPSAYAPYTSPATATAAYRAAAARARQPTVEEQVAAATHTADVAAEAAASGRYSGVHEVPRPGSRREEELRAVLQEEIAKEGERQALLGKVADDGERARLVKYFTAEREEAKRRILALSNAAQAALYH